MLGAVFTRSTQTEGGASSSGAKDVGTFGASTVGGSGCERAGSLVFTPCRGWVTAEWRKTENNRRARYYRLTPAGKKQLSAEVSEFEKVMRAITMPVWAPGTPAAAA